jgi:cytosine/adenosine deaminase-related metal-dependent hydrolase
VTPDPEQPKVRDGARYIGAVQRIARLHSRTDPAPSGFDSARVVRTGGVVYAGRIDLHSHVVYNILLLWSPPGTTELFIKRVDWPRHADKRVVVGFT